MWPSGDQQGIPRVISYGIILSFSIGAARYLLVAKTKKNLFEKHIGPGIKTHD